jgi:hypothetical protein
MRAIKVFAHLGCSLKSCLVFRPEKMRRNRNQTIFIIFSMLTVVPMGFFLFLQLWHPPLLEQIRATLIGKLLLGTTFVWWDFPHYILGCIFGWLWLRQLHKIGYAKKS